MHPEHLRRYRILSKLADGGHGSVYHARLEGPAGFSKDVAIKLLHAHLASEGTLRRFRAEARLLALVRDSTVVGVDPPIFLDGQWALVMEYVEGASLAMLLKHYGTVPPGVAIEVVERLARTLDNVWRQKGPDGRPLHLVHRDIKPANVQLTADGNLRLLDLGIATAEYMHTEATTSTFAGTPGYMAPERLTGDDGPSGDIFSLGIVLHEMLLGKRPPIVTDPDRYVARVAGDDANLRRLLHLATQMFSLEARSRPTAREVERRAAQIRLVTPGPYLRDWADNQVGGVVVGTQDALCGRILTEDPSAGLLENTMQLSAIRPARTLVFGAAWLSMAALLLTLGVGAVGTAAVLGLLSGPPPEALSVPKPETGPYIEPEPRRDTATPPVPAPEPEPSVEPQPVEEPERVATVEPAPVKTPPVKPRPLVAPPTPKAPPPAVVLEDLRIRSQGSTTTLTLVLSNSKVRPLHWLEEASSAKYPSIYNIVFRGGVSELPSATWPIDQPAEGQVVIAEKNGSLVVAVRSTAQARFELTNSDAIWTLTVR